MAKSNLKLLLVAFTTNRTVDGEEKRVRFAAKSVVNLTDDELQTLDKLTKATGKLHYREPIQEGGSTVSESEPEVVAVPDYAGQDVPLDKKTVDQLKAFLTFHSVPFADNANKADLQKAATDFESDKAKVPAGGAADPDGGL